MSNPSTDDLKHHKRFEYCCNRLKYRDGKKTTAVKVYTVANESRHLLVFGVPKINLSAEVKREFGKIGPIAQITVVTDNVARNVELELFTDCYHVVYEQLHIARKAKKFLDAKVFYGGILHISYAPEYETVDDVRGKIRQRQSEVRYRMRMNDNKKNVSSSRRKRKNSCDNLSEPSDTTTAIYPIILEKKPRLNLDNSME